ncbi:MAG: hypothetical protein IPG06_16795 [Haliea sp.]|nr:hypothetical protein [Haliea sp.]
MTSNTEKAHEPAQNSAPDDAAVDVATNQFTERKEEGATDFPVDTNPATIDLDIDIDGGSAEQTTVESHSSNPVLTDHNAPATQDGIAQTYGGPETQEQYVPRETASHFDLRLSAPEQDQEVRASDTIIDIDTTQEQFARALSRQFGTKFVPSPDGAIHTFHDPVEEAINEDGWYKFDVTGAAACSGPCKKNG